MDCVWHPNCGTCPRVCGTRIPCCASGLWSSPCTAILGGKLPLLLSLVKLPAAHQLLGSGLMEYLFFGVPVLGSCLAMAEPAACPSSPCLLVRIVLRVCSCLGKGNVLFPSLLLLHATFVLLCCATQNPKPVGKHGGILGSLGMGASPALLPAPLHHGLPEICKYRQTGTWLGHGWHFIPTLNFRRFVALTYLNTLFCGLI